MTRPLLIIICGWPLSGKTQLATKLHNSTGIHAADIDKISQVCLGIPSVRSKILNQMELGYELLHQTVRAHIELASSPKSLIIAATYSRLSSWNFLFKIIKPHYDNISIKVLWVRPVDDSHENVSQLLLNRAHSGYYGTCNTIKEYFDVKRRFVFPPLPYLLIDSWFSCTIAESTCQALDYINN
jgi:predicted kinase